MIKEQFRGNDKLQKAFYKRIAKIFGYFEAVFENENLSTMKLPKWEFFKPLNITGKMELNKDKTLYKKS